jgi:osmoprotectant transport system permease protein
MNGFEVLAALKLRYPLMTVAPSRQTLRSSCWCGGALTLVSLASLAATPPPSALVRVGSKAFTESVILGDIVAGQLRSDGIASEHRRELGGTRILWNALLAGEIDVYPEYTGTLLLEILDDPAGEHATGRASESGIAGKLRTRGLGMIGPLGFDNSYSLGMLQGRAAALAIETISDLRSRPSLRFGLSNEFMARTDGWPGLQKHYGLEPQTVRGLQHDLAYRALSGGSIDVTDLYSTDAEIAQYGLKVLQDDRRFFPRYDAILLYRLDMPAPAVASLALLEHSIDQAAMIRLNALAAIQRQPEEKIAADFLRTRLHRSVAVDSASRAQRIAQRTLQHLFLVGSSLLAAILTAIPLGVLSATRPRAGSAVLGLAGIVQTVPSLALLAFLIPWLGIGTLPAIFALYLYSLLPIVRNTQSGLLDIPWHIRESAEALGLSSYARLRLIELPLAARSITSGIKTAAVINVGTATLGALIGAGGYGQPILTGIRLADTGLILEGAIPAALLALGVQGLFTIIERRLTKSP